jgi:hypothetical protein
MALGRDMAFVIGNGIPVIKAEYEKTILTCIIHKNRTDSFYIKKNRMISERYKRNIFIHILKEYQYQGIFLSCENLGRGYFSCGFRSLLFTLNLVYE